MSFLLPVPMIQHADNAYASEFDLCIEFVCALFFHESLFLSNVPVISFCCYTFVVLIVYFHCSSTV